VKAAGLDRITLHACRHTFASLMIAAGVNAKALQSYMGHSSIRVTFDLYGHLMPGNESRPPICSTATFSGPPRRRRGRAMPGRYSPESGREA
jgi:hypothetical protein